ncbi:MAG TPA: hypothetical protein VI316_02245 [Candidatus Dormibacteraeota bacterium]
MAAQRRRPERTPVYVEAGTKKVFACALEWPGWCRAARTEDGALEALVAARPRYAVVAAQAGLTFPEAKVGFEIVARVSGSAMTDFGVPGEPAPSDARPMPSAETERCVALVSAAWTAFDRVVSGAPAELRKGPRGGGRDRDAIVDHVLAAEAAYGRKLGVRVRQPARDDDDAVAAFRDAILEGFRALSAAASRPEKGWAPRYAARRITWHILDHAWEIEDRGIPAPS